MIFVVVGVINESNYPLLYEITITDPVTSMYQILFQSLYNSKFRKSSSFAFLGVLCIIVTGDEHHWWYCIPIGITILRTVSITTIPFYWLGIIIGIGLNEWHQLRDGNDGQYLFSWLKFTVTHGWWPEAPDAAEGNWNWNCRWCRSFRRTFCPPKTTAIPTSSRPSPVSAASKTAKNSSRNSSIPSQ